MENEKVVVKEALKTFEVDFDKVKTIEEVVVVLKSMSLRVYWYQENCPEKFKEIYEKGFLKVVVPELTT